MARTLDKNRPTSTISDILDSELIEHATGPAQTHLESGTDPVMPPNAKSQAAIPPAPQRTGEHSDIQKMYRLTPTALNTVQELSRAAGTSLGFEVNNSAVIRSILRCIHQALPDIQDAISEQLAPCRQPSTAIGNEHARDAIESNIASAIRSGITKPSASSTDTNGHSLM